MDKGILLETDGRFGVALTPRGEFCRVAVEQTWQVGEEVPLTPVRSSHWKRWALFAAAAVLLLLLVPVGWQAATPQALAFITVDINPSVELVVDATGHVITSRGLNHDGTELLRETGALKRKETAAAIGTLTAKAIALQKLDPASGEGVVFVAVAPARERLDEETAAKLEAEALAAVEASLEEQATAVGAERRAQVVTLSTTAEVRQAAEKNGLSLGKQALKQELEDRYHVEIQVDDLKQMAPAKLVEKVQQTSGVEIKLGELMRRDTGQAPPGQEKKGDNKTPPGQEKKGDNEAPPGQEKNGDNKMPPGQEKKGDDKSPPGQEKKGDDKSPPGQEKKGDDKSPPGQEKKGDDKSPPGQEKKGDDKSPSGQEKKGDDKMPPGQEKKGDDKMPPGQEKKGEDKSPPGQEKKGDDKAPPGRGKQG